MSVTKEKARLLAKIVAVLLVLETAIHLFVRVLPLGRAASLLDGVLLCALAAPVFYVWIMSWRESHREAEDRFRAVVDNLGVGVSLISPRMEVLSLNKRMREWFPDVEAAGKPMCYRSYNSPARETTCSYCPVIKTLEDARTHEAVTATPTPAGIVNYRVVSSPITDGAGRVAAVIEMVEDVTKAVQEEARLQEALLRQARLIELLRLSLESAPLSRRLERMLECLISTPWLAVERKGCVMVREGAALAMRASTGLPAAGAAACARVPLGACLCGRVAQSGEEVVAKEVDARHETVYEGMTDHGHLVLPLKAGGEVLGALNLYLKEGALPDEAQREFARAAAGIFSGVVLLARSEERLLQSQKMEAVGRLAGGVAHDFNNILTAIKGYAGFLRAELGADDPRRRDVAEITKAADRAADLTGRLLAFSRRQTLEPRPLDLNEVVKGMAAMLRCLAGDGVVVELDLDPALAAAAADKGQLEQVIMNLVVNARDAMPGGGRVTISTANAFRSCAEGGPSQSLVRVSVADTGTGIEPAVLEHIFEPFFSTKPKDKGTGLGLSTVYGIVKQSGGDIEVSSAPGKGSVFKILLPAQRAPAPAGTPPEPAAAPSGTETILLVEDEAPVRAIAERHLAGAGYRVLAASGAEDALALLDRRPDLVDLLITDVLLPGMDGPELAARALAGRPDMKVLFMSGYADGKLREGMTLLLKPFSAEGLASKVREVLDRPAAQKSG